MPAVPYPISANAICEVAIEYELNGQQNIGLFHYFYDDTPIIPDGLAFLYQAMTALAAPGQVYARMLAALSSDVGQVDMYAQWIYPTRYAYATHPTPDDATGPAGAAPQNVAVAITKRGIEAKPGYIGTLHMGAVPTDWIVNGRVVQPVGVPYKALADAIPLALSINDTDDMVPILFNRTTPPDSAIITEAFYQSTTRVMRRRTVGVGS